jgi:hypothetical protein
VHEPAPLRPLILDSAGPRLAVMAAARGKQASGRNGAHTARASFVMPVLALATLPHFAPTAAWQRWDPQYPEDPGNGGGLSADAFLTLPDLTRWGPGPRAGHSLLLFNETLYLFGGRGNEAVVAHTPKTYEITRVDGSLAFATYDQKQVKTCGPNTTFEECYNIDVGVYYNDVWAYSLAAGCDGAGAGATGGAPCAGGNAWRLVAAGAPLGGCRLVGDVDVCTHPQERTYHGGAVFADGVMLIYGGFSPLCEDYCSDVWALDLAACGAGVAEGEPPPPKPAPGEPPGPCTWHRVTSFGRSGPGKRWRFAAAQEGDRYVLYGGQRMWHGFGQANSLANRWADAGRYERGGFLDDVWIFTWNASAAAALPASEPRGTWEQVMPRESCYTTARDGGASALGGWEHRDDVLCTIHWPTGRASAGLVLRGDAAWLFGGFTASFPYPHVMGRGAGAGVGALSSDSITSYPGLPHFLDDVWRLNFTTGLWTRLSPRGMVGATSEFFGAPAARAGHTFVAVGDSAFLLFGGFATNAYHADTWLYNVTEDAWLRVGEGAAPLLPSSCTSDVTVDAATGEEVVVGYSVRAEPTRGTPLDGLAGRASAPVFVVQPRRRAPGWDGCRDRADGRTDLPGELQYASPAQRGGGAAVYSAASRRLLLYGGDAIAMEQLATLRTTYVAAAVGDLWAWSLDACASNCSGRGACVYGHCYCRDGFYGRDCSNVTCPGDYCVYNTTSHVQSCTHCCSAPHDHADADIYEAGARKVACDAANPGASHGVCNGFGMCQCAPPFVGDDCSIRACPGQDANCNGHGVCSMEYPVARCMCDPGWTGPDCATRMCLNNCSWPNGDCDGDGTCVCRAIANPYKRTDTWALYGGPDCSYVTPFAAARTGAPLAPALLLAAAGAAAIALLLSSLAPGVGDGAVP